MKCLIYTIILFTATAASARNSVSYSLSNIDCERGTRPNMVHISPSSVPTQAIVDKQTQTLSLIFNDGSHKKVSTYALGVVGEPGPRSDYRETYLAMPLEFDGDTSNFYLQLSEDQTRAYIRTTDPGHRVCGGGLVNFNFLQ
jgi:hypothetical protein